MKRLLNILLFMCLAFAAMAQQKPPYVQTHTPQVLSNWATWSTQFMGLPSADAFTMPLYIPDSIKAKSVWIKTGAARGIFIYNPVSGLLEQVGNYKPTTDSLASVKFNKSGGSLTGKLYLFADAVDPLEPITKNQFDNYVTGITWKKEVKVATTANITLSGIQTIDGIALSVDDRVLVMNQTSSSQNGLYLVKSGAWVRTTDADTGPEISTATVLVGFGTLYKNTVWTCTNVSDPVIGTDAVAFGQMSGAGTYVNGTGLTLNANVFDVNYTTLDTHYKFTTLTGYGITDAIRNSAAYGGGFQTASIAISGSIYANGGITSDNAIQTTGQVRAGSVSSRGSGSAYDLYDITTDNLWRTYSTGNTLHLQVPNLGDVYTADYTTQVLTFIKSPVLPGSNMTGDINYYSGAVTGNLNPLAGIGILWRKNSDYGKIYFESTSNSDGSSNLIFETGDDRLGASGIGEGIKFRNYDGTNTLDYFTANVAGVLINGNLGIGYTTGQSYKLAVNGSARIVGILSHSVSNASDYGSAFQNSSSTGYGTYITGGNATNFALRVDDYLGNTAMTVLGNGNVNTTGSVTANSFTAAGISNSIRITNGSNYNYGIIGIVSSTGLSDGDVYGLGYMPNPVGSFTPVLTWSSKGNVGIAGIVTATQYRLSDLNPPVLTSTSPGTKGEIRWSGDFVNLCVATNTWVRAALLSW